MAAGAAVLIAALIAPRSSPAFTFLQPEYKWPGNPATIKYFNSSKKQDPAFDDAARAWNDSGIKVRFRQTGSKRRADLVIKSKNGVPCGNGFAQTQLASDDGRKFFPTSATIDIGSGGTPKSCRYVDVITMAHEMGHVIGLDHEDRRCAVMNSSAIGFAPQGDGPQPVAPASCEGLEEGTWFCQILTEDDLKGARKIYEGKPRVKRPEFCPFPGPPQTARGDSPALGIAPAPFEDPAIGPWSPSAPSP